MRIKPEYAVRLDEDDFCIIRHEADGTEKYITPLSATAAMAFEGFQRGMSRETIIDAVVNEFDGADRAVVAADLDALAAQLIALGFAEE